MDSEAVESIQSLALAGQKVEIDGITVLTLPDGYHAVIPDVEKFKAYPDRKRGKATFLEIADFARYVERHRTPGTEIYASQLPPAFTAYLDGNAAEAAGWSEFQATWSLKMSREWKAWDHPTGWFEQVAFADFLEARMGEIADPPGGELHTVIRAFKVNVNAVWENTVSKVHNGTNLVFREEVNTGNVVFPDHLIVVLKPFDGAEKILPASDIGLEAGKVMFRADLKFTKPDASGKVKFGYALGEDFLKIQEDIDVALRAHLATELTGVPIFRGSYERPSR